MEKTRNIMRSFMTTWTIKGEEEQEFCRASNMDEARRILTERFRSLKAPGNRWKSEITEVTDAKKTGFVTTHQTELSDCIKTGDFEGILGDTPSVHNRDKLFTADELKLKDNEIALDLYEQQIAEIREQIKPLQEYVDWANEANACCGFETKKLTGLKNRLARIIRSTGFVKATIEKVTAQYSDDPDDPNPTNPKYNLEHWNKVYKWEQDLIDALESRMSKFNTRGKFGLYHWLTIIGHKRDGGLMSYARYVKASGLIHAELYRRTKKRNHAEQRQELLKKWVEHNLAERHNNNALPEDKEILFDPETCVYSDSRISEDTLINAIDTRAKARKMASTPKQNCTYESALMSLCDYND